jgi:hypothetical protein
MGHVIKEVYLYVVIHEDGDEGLPAFTDPVTGVLLPLLGTDRARFESLQEIAIAISKKTGLEGKWIKLSGREEL